MHHSLLLMEPGSLGAVCAGLPGSLLGNGWGPGQLGLVDLPIRSSKPGCRPSSLSSQLSFWGLVHLGTPFTGPTQSGTGVYCLLQTEGRVLTYFTCIPHAQHMAGGR